MRKLFLIAIVAVIGISASIFFIVRPQTSGERGIETTVARIVDGDTIELANHDVVRLLGLDAPEHDQPYFQESKAALDKLVGKVIRMEKDTTNKDRYGRYLRYIYLDDHFINLELVQSGMAFAYVVAPDKKYEKEFLEAENLARTSGIGVWQKSDYSGCVGVTQFHYNARGDDTKNITDEFFVVKNSCGKDLVASNWTVKNQYNSYGIPAFDFRDGSSVRIITGSGKNGGSDVFMSIDHPIWDNKGDVLYLRDESGRVVDSKSYKNE